MAIVLIENTQDVRGYFSIKGNELNKSLEYYIEANPIDKDIELDIIYVVNKKGFTVKKIKEKDTTNKKLYKGSIRNIISFSGTKEPLEDEGICIIDKNKGVLFAEYLSKRKVNIEDIVIEDLYLKNKSITKTKLFDTEYDKKPLYNKSQNIIKIKRCFYKIKKKEKEKIKNKQTLMDREKIIEFTKKLSEKATTVKKTKIYSKEDLIMKMPYYIFKEALIKDNKYFLITDSIVNLFKENIKKYGHFLISIIFKRNGEIKYIQIGIPDKNASLEIQHLNTITYKQIPESNSGYWLYKYEI